MAAVAAAVPRPDVPRWIVADLEGVAQSQGVCGRCWDASRALHTTIVRLGGGEFWPALFLELILRDENKNSSSCAVKGFLSLSFFPCYFILSLKPIRSFYFIDFKDRWELMLHDGHRMAAHLLENYKTDSGKSAQLDLFSLPICACLLR